jgi:cytochrome c biogenesis protein CcmG/thiol:disulfide interchange protein DsbE
MWVMLAGSAVSFAAAEVGQHAPALVAPELNGNEFDLSQQRGRVVVLNVWATWCSPCRAEMPVLDAFYRAHRDEGLTVIGLSADDPHDRKDVVKVMRAFSYPAALAADAKTNGFGRPTVVPITYVVDADGVIAAILLPSRSGGVTGETLDRAVQPLLARTPE